MRILHSALALLALLLSPVSWPLSPADAQDDPFAAGVRTTPWLSPADEQKAFKLPPGFEINLVAAEPDIQKPLNMAFDERGRIWLSCSVEYPYAAPLDKPGRDCIKVLEDTDGDGRFEKIQTFADGLNIPIGIYPWKGGCIAWSIPNIWHFEDTDGDGTCDKRTVLYGPFDHTRDTHGMCNAFRRGWDGWVYACHGFNNDSHVKGRDGHEVHMNSGNTFRFQLDGSRIEHFTYGQVNPFGMCFDELFNIFTADCHSKPLTQLIRGGYYPSFGKAHDGLGFVPSMMDHLHGSTAICGLVCYSGENFPQEYRGNFLSGNVMTSRINRNRAQYHGSTIRAIEQPDFLSTTDPWFRPVDLQVGPDGALYILDFYNRIIGHYEVPLPHPGRDRTSGRIWRVAYAGKGTGDRPQETGDRGQGTEGGAVGNAVPGVPGGGKDAAAKPAKMPGDLTKMNVAELIAQLDSPQLEHRLRVQHYLADVTGPQATDAIQAAWKNSKSGRQRVALLWLMEGLKAFDVEAYSYIGSDERNDAKVRTHALLAVGNSNALSTKLLMAQVIGLTDKDPSVRRAAASSPRQYRSRPDWLVEALQSVPEDDALLRQSIRISIRDSMNLWRSEHGSEYANTFARTVPTMLEPLSGIAAVSESPGAVNFVLALLEEKKIDLDFATLDVAQMARIADAASVARLISAIRRSAGNDPQEQAQAIQLLQVGLAQSDKTSQELSGWGNDVARELLATQHTDTIGWTAVPVEGQPASESPWVIAPRPCADGQNDQPFYYSLPKGEQRTGIYRSAPFEIPAKLSFWCAGHSGFPNKPLNDGNWVRLRDATTHAVLAESRPPRNDTARRVEWDLSKIAPAPKIAPSPPAPLPPGERGDKKMGYVELVDGDAGDAYAWQAVGRFSLAALNPSDTARKQQLAAEIVGKLKLASLRPQLATLVASPSTDGAARAAIGQALVALDPDSRAAALVAALNDPSIPDANRVKMGYAITVDADGEYLDNLREVMKRAPSRLQTLVAETLAGDAAGADALLTLVEAGLASPRLLLAANVSSKFGTLKSEALDKRVAAATARLPPVSETLDKLILQRRVAFAKATPSLEKGLAVFTKHCAACHQIAGKGSVVGPQLDGIGSRGLERIIEDVLDPNRNVDVAFRTTTMRLQDGRVVTGLFRRAEGAQLVFADIQGKEFTLAKDQIDQETKTALSLMPANVPEIVPAQEFHDLVGYLLDQKAAQK